MKVLVLGSGAKDHAIAWWFSRSRLVDGLFMAPPNPGTTEFAVNLKDVDPSDKEKVLKVCRENNIDFVFIGTEAPLIAGVVDFLNENGIPTFGAPTKALKIEGDRRFSREFAKRHNIPMPSYKIIENKEQLSSFLNANTGKTFTIKPNSISPSRVIVNSSDSEVLYKYALERFCKNESVIIEEHINGLPVTVTMLLDEKSSLMLPVVSEYTKREHGDEDIVTGGMGAICPVPLNDFISEKIKSMIINPTLKGLKDENLFYKGVLTFAVVISNKEPYLVDYHVRLNDPATQAIVPLIKNDIVEIMDAMQKDRLSEIKLETTDKCAVSVVVASEGYPLKPVTGKKLENIKPQFFVNSIDNFPYVFFGAVKENEEGEIVTSGGRAVTVVGISDNIIEANNAAYNVVNSIKFDGSWHREDIGNKFFTD